MQQDMEHNSLLQVMKMISYRPFYQTLYRKGATEYYLIYKQGVDSHTTRRRKPITTTTLNTLCEILTCREEDIPEYLPGRRVVFRKAWYRNFSCVSP